MSIPKWAYKFLVQVGPTDIVPLVHLDYAEKLAKATGGRIHPIADVADYGPRFIKLKPAAQAQLELSEMARACAAVHAASTREQADV